MYLSPVQFVLRHLRRRHIEGKILQVLGGEIRESDLKISIIIATNHPRVKGRSVTTPKRRLASYYLHLAENTRRNL